MRRIIIILAIAAAAIAAVTGIGLAVANAGTQPHTSLIEIIKPDRHITLFLETGLGLKTNVICHSSTNQIGAPNETMRCYQFNK